MDIVQEYRNRFELYRWIIIANTIVALLTNALALYLVIYRSPKHIKTYKYVLLNILLCALVTDVIFEVVVLPSPLLAVLAVYPRGLVSALGTEASFVCQVLAIASVSEFLAALLIAFFYRYLALQDGISFRGKRIERRHYWFAIVLLMVLAPTVIVLPLVVTYTPEYEFKKNVLKSHPEFLPFFDQASIFQFGTIGLLVTCGAFFCWSVIWTILVTWCVWGIINQFRVQQGSMHSNTYRLHVQLIKSLVVQAIAPLVLIALPVSLVAISVLFGLEIIDTVCRVTDLTMSIHSTVNSLAVIVLVAPYRKAVLNIFRKMSGMSVSVSTVVSMRGSQGLQR